MDNLPPANDSPPEPVQLSQQQLGAIHHHLSWVLKLLGHPPESLHGQGPIVLSFQVSCEHDELTLHNYALTKEIDDESAVVH